MNISAWLDLFKTNWINHNIEGVLSLFDSKVIYFETPFHKIETTEELKLTWGGINNQESIHLDLVLFATEGNNFTVKWRLSYTQDNLTKNCAGTYLITLNEMNKCTYFFHCCECK